MAYFFHSFALLTTHFVRMTTSYSKKFELKFNGAKGFSELQVETYADDPINVNFVIISGKRNIDRPGDKYESTVYNLTESHYAPIERHKLNIYFLGVPGHQYNHIRRIWEELSVFFPQLKSVQMPWDVKTSILTYLVLQQGCPFPIIQTVNHFMGAYVPHRKGQYAKKHIVRFNYTYLRQRYAPHLIKTITEFMLLGPSPEEYYLAHKNKYHAIGGTKVIKEDIEKFYEWIAEHPPREPRGRIDDLPFDKTRYQQRIGELVHILKNSHDETDNEYDEAYDELRNLDPNNSALLFNQSDPSSEDTH